MITIPSTPIDRIRPRFPLTAALLDNFRVGYSTRLQRWVHNLDSQRIVRGIPSVYASAESEVSS